MIVGIGHVQRVGKDTAAEALCRDLGFVRKGFADPLKDLAFATNPLVTSSTRTVNTDVGHGRLQWVVQGVGGWEQAKNTYPEVRIFLQNLGQAARKVFGETFWIDRMFDKVGPEDRIVIPDVRHRNEADEIRARGGVLIRINRPGKVAAGHVSETDLVDYDWDEEFMNDRSIAELQATVVAFVKNRIAVAGNGRGVSSLEPIGGWEKNEVTVIGEAATLVPQFVKQPDLTSFIHSEAPSLDMDVLLADAGVKPAAVTDLTDQNGII
jgi:hypothetical protein